MCLTISRRLNNVQRYWWVETPSFKTSKKHQTNDQAQRSTGYQTNDGPRRFSTAHVLRGCIAPQHRNRRIARHALLKIIR
jgi:ribosomal protein S18 acetylase RimI-like enzyme